jgi:hypothetical protein
MGEVPLPSMNVNRDSSVEVKKRLMSLLHSMGMKDVEITTALSGGSIDDDLELSYDRREEIKHEMDKKSSEIFR